MIFEVLHTNTSFHLNIPNHNNLDDIEIMDSKKPDNQDKNTHNYRNHFADNESHNLDKIVSLLIQFQANNIKILEIISSYVERINFWDFFECFVVLRLFLLFSIKVIPLDMPSLV